MQTIEVEPTGSVIQEELAVQLDRWQAFIKTNLRGLDGRLDEEKIPLGCFPLFQAAIDVAAFASAFVADEEAWLTPDMGDAERVELDRRVRWLSYCAAQLCTGTWPPQHGLTPND